MVQKQELGQEPASHTGFAYMKNLILSDMNRLLYGRNDKWTEYGTGEGKKERN